MWNKQYAQLNADQKHCFDIILDGINEYPKIAHFFIYRPARIGKTFLYKVFCNYFQAKGKIIQCMASSGIATLLLPVEMISYSRFKILLNVNENSVCDIKRNTQLYHLI